MEEREREMTERKIEKDDKTEIEKKDDEKSRKRIVCLRIFAHVCCLFLGRKYVGIRGGGGGGLG